ncbi:methionine--tRNA ligase [Candidatus Wolfebacteria bacterium RIFCSPHIGHO2_01_FULL_48_22]|uniref:Methionine--tRNA ligase n=1 Tax=Candidatus Wolfebacteria bacterium RIFCSPHIGHO2_01_FULL_48_22 TaxID=1802555 RepID=A0A1F8DR00_9BACT|nr:MAG: methionine--tRNA ligase [Candidatus Wolfebacteria bacterium RIFCSPHIGHO2_01_FULL_48_22]
MSGKNLRGDARPFYITTTLPYVNAPLHLGHATEIIRADAIARYKRLSGYEVFFNTGTDEHGMKILESAQKAGKPVLEFVDECAVLFKETLQKFGVSSDTHYVRTTDTRHVVAVQEFWRRCAKNGFIYKKNYQAKYCVGCEEEKTDSELVNGKCPEHDRVPELISEENYFFKLSAFEKPLLDFYNTHSEFVVPSYRLNELREFIKRGLKDFSISRLKSKLPWGVPVPGDDTQTIYVWFDALVNYISTLGWPAASEAAVAGKPDENLFDKFWVRGTPTQYCGKNNTRFQGLMWQAMLLAAGLPHTHTVVVDGFILGEEGTKMSKTLGNVIDPLEVVREYGTDALRYFVLREFHPFEDTAVSKEKLKEWYNANLADGLGNLVSRIITMGEKYGVPLGSVSQIGVIRDKSDVDLENFDLKKYMDKVWSDIQALDKQIQEKQPFKVFKTDPKEAVEMVIDLYTKLAIIADLLTLVMPETALKIKNYLANPRKLKAPLFPRKE